MMNLKALSRIGSLMVIFFFLPSIGFKIWDYFVYAPWPAKSWLVYFGLGVGLIFLVRRRFRKRTGAKTKNPDDPTLLQIAKERLVQGEITLAEYKEIKQELGGYSAVAKQIERN
jgi:uncharacterized membrane protein